MNILLLILPAIFLSAQAPPAREYQVKAVFLFNFTQFVEWPPSAFSSSGAPLVIGILGKDPFGPYLQEAVSGEKVNGHPLVIQHYNNLQELRECHLLFINQAAINKPGQLMEGVKGRSILLISDDSNFLNQGGMINFFTKNNKIQIQINPETVKAANLTISSKLLRLAEIIVPTKKI